MSTQTLITKTQLKEIFGLTPKWIERLGEPDEEKLNPRYRSAATMKLYAIARVEQFIEDNRDEYNAMRERSLKRSKQANERILKQVEVLYQQAKNVVIEWSYKPKNLDRLDKRVYENGQEMLWSRNKSNDVFVLSDNARLAYLRHNCTNYDTLINFERGSLAQAGRYQIIRERVDIMTESYLEELKALRSVS